MEFVRHSEYLVRILVSCVCGCMIGYERKNRNKEAGVRTHAIVAIGAAMLMIVSKYGFADSIRFDASRVAAQIVSGVGFLGAGMIFVRNQTISGLTTAAGIWTTCGIGMAIGSGMYYIGGVTTLIIVCIQVVMHKDFFLVREPYRETIVMTIYEENHGILHIQEVFDANNIKVTHIEIQKEQANRVDVIAEIIVPKEFNFMKLMDEMILKQELLSCRWER